jgi:hypothetical protein
VEGSESPPPQGRRVWKGRSCGRLPKIRIVAGWSYLHVYRFREAEYVICERSRIHSQPPTPSGRDTEISQERVHQISSYGVGYDPTDVLYTIHTLLKEIKYANF